MKNITKKLSLLAAALALAGGCSRETDTTSTTVTDPVTSVPAPDPGLSDSAIAPNTGVNDQPLASADTNTIGSSGTGALTNNALASTESISGATGAPGANQTGQASSTATDPSEQVSRSSQYIDFEVVNQQSEKLGTVEAVWEDPNGEPAYLGVKRPDTEKLAIIPAEDAQVNESRKSIRLSLSPQAIAAAPTLEENAELDEQFRQKAVSFYQQHRSPGSAGATGAAPQAQQQDQATIQLKQEQATVGKRTVDAGGVLLRKVVRTETNREPVTLQSEELVIERVPGGGPATNANFAERDIYIPLRREVPVVQKDTVIKETVRVGKDVEQRQTDVTTPVREEQLKIQQQGQTDATGAPGSTERGTGTAASPDTDSERQAAPKPDEQ